MDTAFQLILKERMDKPMPLDPGQSCKMIGNDFYPEMRFPTFTIPGMAAMRFALILDGQDTGSERRFEFLPDDPRHGHKFSFPCSCLVDI